MATHVLQFFSTLNSGGAENRMMDVYRSIDPKVVTFDFAVLHSGKHVFDDEVLSMGSKKYVLPDPRSGLLHNYIAVYKFFKAHPEFVAVHAHMNWYSGVALLAAKHAGVPVRVAHARNLIDPRRALKDKVFCNLGKLLIGMSATHKMSISTEAAECIFGKHVAKNKRFMFVPNAIDEKKYSVLDEDEREKLRTRLGIPQGKKALVNIANLRSQKNHMFLLEVARKLKESDYPFVLYLIGEGDLRKAIEDKIREYNLEQEVFLLGRRNDVPEILCAFDGMVFPSLYEGLGGVVLEAQLVGVPSVVSTGIPKVADVGVDMVRFLSLDELPDVWARNIVDAVENNSWDYLKTKEAFMGKGYSIISTAETYLSAYGLSKDTVEKALR